MAQDAEPVQIKLRIRSDIRDRLVAAAQLSGRTLNSELVERLEASLREDDSRGGAEQAWLVTRMVRVMDDVSDEYDAPWWKSYRSWRLVFRSFWYLITQYRPDRDPAPQLSAEGRRQVAAWELEFGELHRARTENARLRIDRDITNRVMRGELIHDSEIQRDEIGDETIPLPKLTASDMAEWLQERAARQKMVVAWWQILPTLRATRRRRKKGRIS